MSTPVREEWFVATLQEPISHYTHAVSFGDLVFVSGCTGTDEDGELVGGDDVELQTYQVLRNLEEALAAAGSNLQHVLKVTLFLTDIRDRERINIARQKVFGSIRPASTLVEVSKLAGILAAELGANIELSKMGGFLHDLGKAMDHNQEGTHASLGADFAKRHGVLPQVVNAIASHHHEVEQESVEAVITEAADAISGARPGARREDLEAYIKRIRTLEDMATSFKGVSQAFAIQAGREVRIIVEPEQIDDLEATRLARDIAKKIEETMQYPGQIRVTVIRETRAVDYAK